MDTTTKIDLTFEGIPNGHFIEIKGDAVAEPFLGARYRLFAPDLRVLQEAHVNAGDAFGTAKKILLECCKHLSLLYGKSILPN